MNKHMTQEVAIKSAWMILEGLGFSRKINGDLEKTVAAVFESAPAADVTPVRHGRWINGRCSECGEHAPFWAMAATYHLSKYCHGCGAKMEGGTD